MSCHECPVVKDRLLSLSESLECCNERLDNILAHLNQSEQRIIALEDRELEIEYLQSQLSELHMQLIYISQQSLKNEIEIVGIPESPDENLIDIVMLAASKVGAPLDFNDIDWISRVGPKPQAANQTSNINDDQPKRSRAVVLRFVRRFQRDDLLKLFRTQRFTTRDLELTEQDHRIYFNERLTKHNRQLFRITKSKAVENGYKYCWTRNGNIYIRQCEGRPAIHIKSFYQVEQLFEPEGEIQIQAGQDGSHVLPPQIA